MQILLNLMFLSVSFLVFFAYRQGIKDGYYIYNQLPLAKPKKEREYKESDEDAIGKTVFLIKEEAEQKLKERDIK